jgi:hypothetical protein
MIKCELYPETHAVCYVLRGSSVISERALFVTRVREEQNRRDIDASLNLMGYSCHDDDHLGYVYINDYN